MIKVAIDSDNGFSFPSKKLTESEAATVTSQSCNGIEYIYYQGDEPIKEYSTQEMQPFNWAGLRLALMTSKAFVRILSNSSTVNMVAYGALQTILSTESNEQYLLQMLQLTMQFTDSEKEEINSILESNYFTVRL